MAEIINATVEKEAEMGFLSFDNSTLTNFNAPVSHAISCREGHFSVQHCDLLIEIQKEAIKKIKIRQATDKGFVECEIGGICDLNYEKSLTRRGRVVDEGRICPTLATENIPEVVELGNSENFNFLYEIEGEIYLIRIRKLTPRECWRLMSFRDEDFEKAEEVNSNTQLYKQCGNSIVQTCLMGIFSQMGFGEKKWNDMDEMEIHHMIERSTNVSRRNDNQDVSGH